MSVSSSGNQVSVCDAKNKVIIFNIYEQLLQPHVVDRQRPRIKLNDEMEVRRMKMDRAKKREQELLEPMKQPVRERFVLTVRFKFQSPNNL